MLQPPGRPGPTAHAEVSTHSKHLGPGSRGVNMAPLASGIPGLKRWGQGLYSLFPSRPNPPPTASGGRGPRQLAWAQPVWHSSGYSQISRFSLFQICGRKALPTPLKLGVAM